MKQLLKATLILSLAVVVTGCWGSNKFVGEWVKKEVMVSPTADAVTVEEKVVDALAIGKVATSLTEMVNLPVMELTVNKDNSFELTIGENNKIAGMLTKVDSVKMTTELTSLQNQAADAALAAINVEKKAILVTLNSVDSGKGLNAVFSIKLGENTTVELVTVSFAKK